MIDAGGDDKVVYGTANWSANGKDKDGKPADFSGIAMSAPPATTRQIAPPDDPQSAFPFLLKTEPIKPGNTTMMSGYRLGISTPRSPLV